MLRKIEERPDGAAAFVVLAFALLAAIAPAGAAAGPSVVTVRGVERDPHVGRAWLLAQLPAEGRLRTTSTGVKAFAPPGEYEAGFVRIPLVPKLALAKRLRSDGSALVLVTIYFRPRGTTHIQRVQQAVTMVRRAGGRPAHPRH